MGPIGLVQVHLHVVRPTLSHNRRQEVRTLLDEVARPGFNLALSLLNPPPLRSMPCPLRFVLSAGQQFTGVCGCLGARCSFYRRRLRLRVQAAANSATCIVGEISSSAWDDVSLSGRVLRTGTRGNFVARRELRRHVHVSTGGRRPTDMFPYWWLRERVIDIAMINGLIIILLDRAVVQGLRARREVGHARGYFTSEFWRVVCKHLAAILDCGLHGHREAPHVIINNFRGTGLAAPILLGTFLPPGIAPAVHERNRPGV